MRICLIGKAGSGKTTILNYLKDKYGFTGVKIAQPIYDIAHKYFKMQGKDRELLQFIGNGFREFRNGEYRDIWINYLFDSLPDEVNVVVDDCRFSNEFDRFKKLGWVTVALRCPFNIRIERMSKRDGSVNIETLKDVSETEMDDFIDNCDYSINSTSTSLQVSLLKDKV